MGDQRRAPAVLFPGKRPYSHYTEGSVAPETVRMGAENPTSAGIRSPDRPACCEWSTGGEGIKNIALLEGSHLSPARPSDSSSSSSKTMKMEAKI